MSPIYSPGDVAKILNVKNSTLRKYSLSLEQLGYTFQKNTQNQRWYNDKDVTLFRKIITLRDNGDITIKAAIEGAFLWVRGGDVAEAQTAAAVVETKTDGAGGDMSDALAELRAMIRAQGQQIEGLSYVITQQNLLINQQLRIESPQPPSVFARFFAKIKS